MPKPVDRRKPKTDPKTQPLTAGLTQPHGDTDRNSRYEAQQFNSRDWQVLQGSVVVAIPQLGWHVVAVEGYGGLIRAQVAGQIDDWGSQNVRAIQSGTSVLMAIQSKSHRGVILGNIAQEMSDPADAFVQASFAGSWSGLNRDVANSQYESLTDEDVRIRGFDTNQLWDQHAGDWGCRTNLGATVLVDNFGIRLATDEVTEIYVDLLEQAVNISSRVLEIQADNFLISSGMGASPSVFAMGRSSWFSPEHAAKIADSRPDDSSYRDSTAGWPIDFVAPTDETKTPEELDEAISGLHFPFVQIVTNDRIFDLDLAKDYKSVAFYGASSIHSEPYANAWISADRIGLYSDSPAYVRYHESVPELLLNPFANMSHNRNKTKGLVSTGVAALSNLPDGTSHFAPLIGHIAKVEATLKNLDITTDPNNQLGTENLYSFLPSERWLEDYRLPNSSDTSGNLNNNDALTTTFQEAVDQYESFTQVRYVPFETPDTYYQPQLNSDHYKLSGINIDKVTGDISIFNEHGAGIRITGNGVFIEGLQVRVAATRDVVLLGRDVQVIGNRNVSVVANKNLRVYSDKNLLLLSGNSGSGGTVIENRSTDSKQTLAIDPEEAVYSGVSVKALRSQVALLGGGVLVKAGDRQNNITGNVVLVADNGDFYTSASGNSVSHSINGRVDVFGPTRANIQSANYYGPNVNIFNGQVAASYLWSSGDVIAKSNITAVTGRVGDSQGQGVGKIREQDQQRALQSIQQLTSTLRDQRQSAKTTYDSLQRVYFVKGTTLHPDTFAKLSTAFQRQAGDKNVYNVAKIQTTYQQEFAQSFEETELENFKFMTVAYKPDSRVKGGITHAWPGRGSTVYKGRSTGEGRLGKLLKDWHDGQATAPATWSESPVTPAELFKTVKPLSE